MQGHTMNLYLRANPSSKAANTCSFALDHPAPSFKSSSLKKKLVLQILVVAIKGGWGVQEDQLALVNGMQGKLRLKNNFKGY